MWYSQTEDLGYDLYRKEHNLYLYVSADSNHHISVKRSLIRGETSRYLRRTQDEASYRRAVGFFLDRLQERGYDRSWASRYVRDYKDRDIKRDREKVQKLFLKLKFDTRIDQMFLNRQLHTASRRLSALAKCEVLVGTAWSTHRNNFRKFYALAWNKNTKARKG